MPPSLSKFATLTRLSVTELVRQPICLLLTLGATVLTITVPLATAHQIGQQSNLARDSALAFQFVIGMLLAAHASCSTLTAEIRSNTALTVLSKPVGRDMLFAAKFAAVAAVVLLFGLCSAAAGLLADRLAPRFFEFDALGLTLAAAAIGAPLAAAGAANAFRGARFSSTALAALAFSLWAAALTLAFFDREGNPARFGADMDWRLIPAAALVTLALVLLSALALSLATRLPAAPTAAILATALFAGLISSYLIAILPRVAAARFALRAALPDLQSFWPADDLAAGGPLDPNALLRASLYATLYTGGLLCFGTLSFRRRQF